MTAVLSLGSNLGDRAAHLAAGVEILRSMLIVRAVSPCYETEPLGVSGQQRYLNLVVLAADDEPDRVLAAAHRAEELRGRLRPIRWGPRTLDVDVVAVGSRTSADPRLTLPHPRAHERAFVLRPWLDLDPAAELPGHGPVRRLLERLDAADVTRWERG